ncbi:hypothetical protein Vadar_016529 [Vaccinium darrowii]|uniref:Uncharacterized protein n=1 Tax=Vaccinium darrowii TaxID=229202 RepID=A0ACB7X1C7_9ERIC|nr:hypothetical protein Vadar_016529 [Vaccinium darrowii]
MMGCFSCFALKEELLREKNSKDEEKLNPSSNHRKEFHPPVLSNMSKLSSGIDRLKTRNNGGLRKESLSPNGMPNIAAQTFSFREVAAATKNFTPESFLGEGGFGRVYKGRLESTGQAVAVKQLDRNGHQGNREFLVEVLMLSLLHHPNLVSLIGYCADGDQRLLVYEFMPLGSLEDHLLDLPPDREPLDWNTRIKIAADAAKELITGRRAIDSTQPHGVQNLVQWARPLFSDRRKHAKLVDPRLKGQFPMRGLYQALSVASMCIQEEAAARPHIRDVVTALAFLANQSYDVNSAAGHIRTPSRDKDEKITKDDGGGRLLKNEKGGRSGRKWESDGSERDDSPAKTTKMMNRDLDRERAVAEAKMWGENWRDKGRQSSQDSLDGTTG